MPPLLDALISYVPWLVSKQFADDPTPLSEAHTEQFEAAVFFADISGFSKLAKHLSSAEGSQGPEHLTEMLNRYFGSLIDLIWQHGGDVVKFAGDAIYAVWPTTAHQESLAEVTHAAVQCAVVTQDRLKNYQLETGHVLALRIGVAAGDVTATTVGGVLKRWELLLVGRPIGQVNVASSLAARGEIVVNNNVYQLLRDGLAVEEIIVPDEDQPFQRVTKLLRQRPILPIPQPAFHNDVTRALSGFVAGAITSRLNANQDEWVAENRRVSVVFISISGVTQTTTDLIEHMNSIMRSMQLGLYHHEGSVRQFIIDDKGTVFIAAFGIPPLTHEDDPLRAVQAANDLRQKINDLGYGCKIGISTGMAFCGPVGNRLRREYAMVGDVVILAARLMSVAPPDKILCDTATYNYARHHLQFIEQPALPLKGFDEPVRMFMPVFEGTAATKPPSTILGREEELAQIDDILQLVRDGDPRTILISGDDGSGKSGVLETLMLRARSNGFRVLFGKGEFVDRASPYHGWRDPLSTIFEVSNLSKTRSRSLTILAKLAIEPELARLAPLLNSILPLDIPETDETNAMSGETRAENTRWLLMQILTLYSRNHPLVIILDDAHWMDSASWALARTVAQRMRSVLMVLSYRTGSKLPNEAMQLQTLPQLVQIELEPLTRVRTAKLIAQRLGAVTVAERVVDLVYQKANGNLLFTDQLVYALRDGGYVETIEGDCHLRPEITSLDQLAIPRSLRDVMTARIDRLPPSLQLIVKVASVIGESFMQQTLLDIFPIDADATQVQDYLDDLQSLDFIEQSTAEDVFQFKQRLVRDVAYELMAFSQRRELHLEIAKWYERNYVYDLSPFYGLLAYHFQQGGDNYAAVGYYEKASQKANYDGAYAEVINFLEQADQLLEGANQTRQTRWSELLGEAYWGIGDLDGSNTESKAVLRALGFSWPETTQRLRLALLRQVFIQFLHRVAPRYFVGRNASRREIWLQAVRAFRRLQEVYYFKNQGLPSLYAGLRMLNLAEQIGGATPELSIARSNFVVSLGILRQHRQAKHYAAQAVKGLQQQKELTIAAVYSRLGLYHAAKAEWEPAINYLSHAVQLYRQQGNNAGTGEGLTLLAFTLVLQGQLSAAATQFEQLDAVAAVSSNREYSAWVLSGRALLATLHGHFSEALDHVLAAQQLLTDAADRASYLNNVGLLALIHARRGEFSTAQAHIDQIDQALARLGVLSYIGAGAYIYRVSALLWMKRQDPATDTSKLRQYLAELRRFGRRFPVLQARYLLLKAMVMTIEGQRQKSIENTLRAALRNAEKQVMSYEVAIIQRQLGQLIGDDALFQNGTQALIEMGLALMDNDTALSVF